ncbi:MAG: hypothetical protein DBX94_02535 [Coriobacteriia bacterium]|nr:MAG: hypothetical protein DBX94_02535 [Coriobacteriia bacterium]
MARDSVPQRPFLSHDVPQRRFLPRRDNPERRRSFVGGESTECPSRARWRAATGRAGRRRAAAGRSRTAGQGRAAGRSRAAGLAGAEAKLVGDVAKLLGHVVHGAADAVDLSRHLAGLVGILVDHAGEAAVGGITGAIFFAGRAALLIRGAVLLGALGRVTAEIFLPVGDGARRGIGHAGGGARGRARHRRDHDTAHEEDREHDQERDGGLQAGAAAPVEGLVVCVRGRVGNRLLRR